MEKSLKKGDLSKTLVKRFEFVYEIGVKKGVRKQPKNKLGKYFGNVARMRSAKGSKVTNDEITKYLYDKNIPFLTKPFEKTKIVNNAIPKLMYDISIDKNKLNNIKKLGFEFANIPKKAMVEGKLGYNSYGIYSKSKVKKPKGIDTGQLNEKITYQYYLDTNYKKVRN